MSFLSKPFPINTDFTSDIKIVLLTVLFPPLFIAIFQPMGILTGFKPSLYGWLLVGGFGLISGFLTFLFGIILPTVLSRLFEELKISGAILYYLLFFITVASANYFYKTYLEAQFIPSWVEYFNVVKYTFLIGLFPLIFSLFWIYNKRLSNNLELAESINTNLRNEQTLSSLLIHGEGENDLLRINADDFLFAESADNYVNVHFINNNCLSKKLLRTSLKSLASQFEGFPYLVRTHRSFIVNIYNVAKAEGNSRGLDLTLKNSDQMIPVSRKHISLVMQLMKSE